MTQYFQSLIDILKQAEAANGEKVGETIKRFSERHNFNAVIPVSALKDKGIEIHLKDLTSDIGIPTIGAAADDTVSKDPELLTIGVGTHLDPEIACIRALTEVAQSRTTHKHGVKVNAQLQKKTQDMGYEKIKRINRMWYSPSREVSSRE